MYLTFAIMDGKIISKEFAGALILIGVGILLLLQGSNMLFEMNPLTVSPRAWLEPHCLQSSQTTFISDWIRLSSGRYNFTFATAGLGSLEVKLSLHLRAGSGKLPWAF
jgi:hypothetical protein